jgi:lipopolysaccharide export LptBFGC system permease protein LptF
MRSFGLKIGIYVIRSILPYFSSAWALLTVILFVQQASRYADIFFNPNIPSLLLWQLTFALLPSVVAFTCPMATLVGVLIGIGKMHSDMETIAIKASGAGYVQIVLPIALLGLVLSLFAFFINWQAVPAASGVVRRVALKTALAKLDSPIETGSLSTEIPNLTVYVRQGDRTSGVWKGIVIFKEAEKILTIAAEGRMSTGGFGEQAEFILKDAQVVSFPEGKVALEKLGNLKIAVKTKKAEIAEKLKKVEKSLEELGLKQLYKVVLQKEGKEKLEAQILFNRRIVLSLAPLIFALLGSVIGIKLKRNSKGNGILLSLLLLISFYLFGLLGEQMARTGQISPTLGSFIPLVVVSLIFLLVLALTEPLNRVKENLLAAFGQVGKQGSVKSEHFGTAGFPKLFDFDLVKSLIKFYSLACLFLITVYLVFTAFELWKFVPQQPNGTSLLLQYLFYLSPYVYLQVSVSCMMIACLAAVAVKSRQNELLALMASGQSIYRVVLLPCILSGLIVGAANWLVQEEVAPETNRRQDYLRTTIRQKGITTVSTGSRIWVTTRNYLFSLKFYDQESGQGSDFYLLDFDGSKVTSVFVSERVQLSKSFGDNDLRAFCQIKPLGVGNKIEMLDTGSVRVNTWNESFFIEDFDPEIGIAGTEIKPSHMKVANLSRKISQSLSDNERRSYAVELEKRYLIPFLPLLATIVAVAFVVVTHRSVAAGVGYSVALWIVFIGVNNFSEQMALNGWLHPRVAIWAPFLLFCALGIYILSKART